MARRPAKPRDNCVDCGRARTEARPLSVRGLCVDCSWDRQTKAAEQMKTREGPYYARWKQGVAAHAEWVRRSG